MTAKEEGHFDISRMQVQVLRSTFCLLVLAVAILVIFSSVALLRHPKNKPVLNVIVDMASGTDDQSARSRRRAKEVTSHAHAHPPVRREILFQNTNSPHGQRPKRKGEKFKSLHKTKTVHKSDRNETKYANHTKLRLDKRKHYNLNATEPMSTVIPNHIHAVTQNDTESRKNKHGIRIRKHKSKHVKDLPTTDWIKMAKSENSGHPNHKH